MIELLRGVTLKKKYYFIPLILIIISVFSSFLAFQKAKEIDEGRISLTNGEFTPVFSGDYNAIVRNIDFDAYYIELKSSNNSFEIKTYDIEGSPQKVFEIIINKLGDDFYPEIIKETISDDLVVIDEIDDYLFSVTLSKDLTYEYNIKRTDDLEDDNDLEIELFIIPDDIHNLQVLYESISLTSGFMAIISVVVITFLVFTKKRK